VSVVLGVLGGAVLAVAAGDVLYSGSLPSLRPWHTLALQHEFTADQARTADTFDDYLAREHRLFEEVRTLQARHFDAALDSAVSRYAPAGSPYAARVPGDWNRSYRLPADGPPRGVALLVHGLSDSPYVLRSIARSLQQAGVTVYGLRLPGHGTFPSALDRVGWEDWLAAVELTVRQIRRDHPGSRFWYVGFSTGATLGLKHSADAVAAGRPELLPDRLFLLSPALGVSPLAPLANLQRLISRWGIAPKARWTDVGAEVDPYKYASFAKNAGAQIAGLIRTLRRDLERMAADGSIARLPPVTGFQSIVDATVSTPDLVTHFYRVLRGGRSELVLFDVNHGAGLTSLLAFSPQAVTAALQDDPGRDYRLTVLSNARAPVPVIEFSLAPGERTPRERALTLTWPDDVVSLSHVALPIAPDDPLYGLAVRSSDGLPSLGALALRGERGALAIAPSEQLRLRANPFFDYVMERIEAAIGEEAGR
jgi:alpha-beta hydrolase superfamily lysophospholipase